MSRCARVVLIFLLYFALLVAITLPHGLATHASQSSGCTADEAKVNFSCLSDQPLTMRSTVDDIVKVYGRNDAASYAAAARAFIDGDDVREHLAIWPPGMMLIEAAFYKLWPSGPIVIYLLAALIALWAGVFTQLALFAMERTGIIFVSLLIPMPVLLFPELQSLNIRMVFSDAWSVATLLLGSGFLAMAAGRLRSTAFIFAGAILLAISCYFRYAIGIAIMAALVIALIFLALPKLRHAACVVFIGALMCGALVAPQLMIGQPGPSPTWRLLWRIDTEIDPAFSFFVEGGGTMPCRLDAELCREAHDGAGRFTPADYRALTFRAMARNPVAWFSSKLSTFWHFWLAADGSAIIMGALAAFLIIVFVRPAVELKAMAILLAAIIAGTLAPAMFLHVELRYLFPLRIMIIFSTLMGLCVAFPRRRIDGDRGRCPVHSK